VVPYYNPSVVFVRPRAGFFIGGAISFGPRVFIGGAFAPWGWGGVSFGWRTHDIIVGGHPWVRTWANRGAYVHAYDRPVPRFEGGRIEHHEGELRQYHPQERRDEHRGERHEDRH
jgi:hypothetical protein